MKKRIQIIIIILVLSTLFTSCREQIQTYNVLVNETVRGLDNIDASQYNKFSMSHERYINTECDEKTMDSILNREYILEYSHSISSSLYCENLDYYYDDKLNCTIAYSAITGRLSRISSQETKGNVIPAGASLQNFDEYICWLKSIVTNVIEINVDDFNINCQTFFWDGTIVNMLSSDKEDIESKVSFYYIEFVKYIGNYRSPETVRFIVNTDGSIKGISYFEMPDNKVYEIIVDETVLNNTIENTVQTICSSKGAINRYTVKSIVWQYYEGRPYLICSVEIRGANSASDNVGHIINLAIDPQNYKTIN